MQLAESIQNSISRIKPSDRRALTIVAVFLSVVFGYVYLVEPVLHRYDRARSAVAELEDKQRRFARQQRMLARRELKLTEYRAQLASLKRRFDLNADSSEAAVSRSINELTYYARLAEVAVSGIRPLEAQPSGDYVEVALEVEANASYDQLHEFFYYIETSQSLLAITDLELSNRADEPTVSARFKLANVARLSNDADGPAPPLLARENRMRLVISRWTGYAPLVVAKHQGYLDTAERRIDLLLADDKVTIERLLVSGEADGVGTSMPELLNYWVKGIPLKVVQPLASAAGTEGIVVRADSEIQSIADLRGQRVAVDPQGILQFVLFKALTSAGMSLDDVQIEDLGPSQVARQIASGTLDVGLAREPFMTELVTSKQARLLYASDDLQGLIVDLLAVTPEVIEKKSETLELLIEGLTRAHRFIVEQPVEAVQIVADWEGQRTDVTFANLAKLELLNGTRAHEYFVSEKVAERLALFEAYLEDIGQPLPLVTHEDLVDPEFFHQANPATVAATKPVVGGNDEH